MDRGRAPNGIGHLMILKSFDNRRFDSRLSKQTTPTACTHPGKVQISYSPCLGNHSGWFSWMDLVSTYILQVRHQPHPWCQQRLQQKIQRKQTRLLRRVVRVALALSKNEIQDVLTQSGVIK